MIYMLCGNDNKKKNAYLKKLCKEEQLVFSQKEINITKDNIFDYAKSVNLFGEYPTVVLEDVLKNEEIVLSKEDLEILMKSSVIFVFFEEKLLSADLKKYQKYAKIEDFSSSTTKQLPKMNVFNIADAFSRKDKMTTWMLYRDAISLGTPPEEISGIIFWKIKSMILTGTKIFSIDELKIRSSELVSLYHKAHRGELDFAIGLEQFILSSLSK